MASLLDSVDMRTQLAGRNRMELLLFRLGDQQQFGINVFKVQEVIQCPPLTKIPNAHPVVRGVTNMRGKTISVMDLAMAIGKRPVQNLKDCNVVVTEYNRVTQGFLVSSVDRIINTNWEEILPPPKGAGMGSYMTAVTRVDKKLIEIIDVEKIMSEVVGTVTKISDDISHRLEEVCAQEVIKRILVVDDSVVARNQVKRTLEQIGYETVLAKNGREALEILRKWSKEGTVNEHISMVISDIEMPEMDGYTLTTEVRRDPAMQNLYIMLHTSLSGVFNNAMVSKVGANKFIPKFNADELASGVMAALDEIRNRNHAA